MHISIITLLTHRLPAFILIEIQYFVCGVCKDACMIIGFIHCPLLWPQIRELEPFLCQADQTSQILWTSSSNAHRSAFSLNDVQHQNGTQPYSSSKYATDLLSLALNTRFNTQVCTTHL